MGFKFQNKYVYWGNSRLSYLINICYRLILNKILRISYFRDNSIIVIKVLIRITDYDLDVELNFPNVDTLYIVPIGQFDDTRSPALASLVSYAEAYFGCKVGVLPTVPVTAVEENS